MSDVKTIRPVWKPAGRVHTGEQPFKSPLTRAFVEPDWRRLPGYKDVTTAEWETALWQRRHTVKNLKEFFFFQAEDGIRGWSVTGVQTCALPISAGRDRRGQRHS